MDEHPTLQDQ